MPKKIIDYSNTIIYKLCCKDPGITEVYVGHTTNFTKRKQQHKTSCNNENIKGYNYYVYQFIRDHGGWDNWGMVEIEKISCTDSTDACKNERRHIEVLGATLNKRVPYITQIEHIEYHKDYMKEHYECYKDKRKEYNKEYHKEYYECNKDQRTEYNKEYYKRNNDRLKERRKEYYEQHKK